MAEAILNQPQFQDVDAARSYLEALRWPHGAVCPHCGVIGTAKKLQGAAHRPGLWKCADCRSQFSVTVGTVFEDSKVPLNKWLMAVHLVCASKKGISSKQLERMLGVTYKTAWFMSHRIREAMTPNSFPEKMGGDGGLVEADETYWGKTPEAAEVKKVGPAQKMKIVSLVERNTGKKRSFHVANVTSDTLRPLLRSQVSGKAHLMTDESRIYTMLGREFATHSTVNHSAKEYARGKLTTNTVESSFALLKRGLIGTFHHVSEQHLQKYCNEFDFRWNQRKVTDTERAQAALVGIQGKRLTYRG